MRNCLVIDLDRCSGCDSCIAACKLENDVDLGVCYNRVHAVGPTGTFPDIEQYWLPLQCQQCENPGCIEVCPTGASYRDEATGVVLVNAEECIGCESCLTGCPYNVRQLNPNTNVVEKCTLCFQRHENETWEPACVHNCCCGARYFGDLDDANSSAAKAVAAAGAENCHQLDDPHGFGSRRPSSCPRRPQHGRTIPRRRNAWPFRRPRRASRAVPAQADLPPEACRDIRALHAGIAEKGER